MKRCALFDFDGTLIDTWRLYLESFRRTLKPYFNRLLSDTEILDLYPTAERRLLRRIVDEERFSGYFESFLVHYHSLHETLNDGLYPGVQEMLNRLRERGYLLGIVTGKSRDAWAMTFAGSGLEKLDVVITDDDVMHPKPNPEGLMAALEALNVAPSQALYVGDSLLDGEAAKAAQVPFGAALCSKAGHEQKPFTAAAQTLGARACFFHPAQIVEYLSSPEVRPLVNDNDLFGNEDR